MLPWTDAEHVADELALSRVGDAAAVDALSKSAVASREATPRNPLVAVIVISETELRSCATDSLAMACDQPGFAEQTLWCGVNQLAAHD